MQRSASHSRAPSQSQSIGKVIQQQDIEFLVNQAKIKELERKLEQHYANDQLNRQLFHERKVAEELDRLEAEKSILTANLEKLYAGLQRDDKKAELEHYQVENMRRKSRIHELQAILAKERYRELRKPAETRHEGWQACLRPASHHEADEHTLQSLLQEKAELKSRIAVKRGKLGYKQLQADLLKLLNDRDTPGIIKQLLQ